MSNAIKVVYKSLDGTSHEAFIQPLKRKEGVLVMHSVLSVVASAIDLEVLRGVSGGVANAGVVVSLVSNAIRAIDGDRFWDLACKLLRYSTIDFKECKDLDSFDGFNGRFSDLYVLVFEALKANYPDFFALMARADSTGFTGPAEEVKQ